MAEKFKCAQCAAELPEIERGAGRPAEYCSKRCRRDAENELRHRKRQIARLQTLVANLRVAVFVGDNSYFLGWGRPADALPVAEARLAEMEKPIEGRG